MVDVGARGRCLRPRLARAGARRGPRAWHRRAARYADLRDPDVAQAPLPRDRGRECDGPADRLGRAPGGRLHPRGVPLPRGADHPCRRDALPRAPGGHRLPGRQRARPAAAAQRERLPAVRRLAATPLRHRRAAQRGVGPRLLVPPALDVGGPVAARRQLPAAVRPGLAPFPDRARHRVHRLAGRHRPRARRPLTLRHHLHLLRAARHRGRRPVRPARRRVRQRLLRDGGLAPSPQRLAHVRRPDGLGRPGPVGGLPTWPT